MKKKATLEQAIALAARAHQGQTDKAGAPYIFHPLRLMLRMKDEAARMAAVLHDTVEDTDVTLAALRRLGFPKAVVEAVDRLSRREGETYEAFIARIKRHPLARRVKLADLADNMDLSRLKSPTAKDRQRLVRYRAAWKVLVDA